MKEYTMLMSMTGFSSKMVQIPFDQTTIQATFTLKTLNARFLEVNCKLPYAFSHLETDLIKLFKSQLLRGTIFFNVHLSNPAAFKTQIEPSLSMVNNYLTALQTIQQKFSLPGQLTINDIVQLPHIFEVPEQVAQSETIQLFFDSVHQLIHDLIKVRQQEGAALLKDLEKRINTMEQLINQIEPQAHQSFSIRKETLLQQLSQIHNNQIQEKDALVSLGAQLDKLTIDEEIVRFKTHLHTLKNILHSPELEKGKQLDFTLQELLRETNTMLAKSVDAQLSSLAVNLKVEVEKVREQVQNIV